MYVKQSIQTTYIRFLQHLSIYAAYNPLQKLLITPKKKKFTWPKQVEQFKVLTRHGEVCVYKYGVGSPVWLIHHWNGAGSDFWPLMRRLEQKGIASLTFDFPAHGHNNNSQVSMKKMVEAFDDISKTMLRPKVIVAHGLAATIVAKSNWLMGYKGNLVLVSPCFNLLNMWKKLLNHLKINNKLLDIYLTRAVGVTRKYLVFDAKDTLKNVSGKVSILLSTSHLNRDELKQLTSADSHKLTIKKLEQKSCAKIINSNAIVHSISHQI